MSDAEIMIRPSSLPGYPDCARRSAARLFRTMVKAMGFDLRELPQGIAASIGHGVHAGAALSLRHKAKHGDAGPADVATDAAIEALRESASGGYQSDRDTPDMNTAERQALRMTVCYRQQVVPQIEPLIIEERLEAAVPWTKQPLFISGQADVIAREPGRVRDLKTSARLGGHSAQVGAYSLVAKSNEIDVNEAAIDWVPRKTLKQPQPDAVMKPYDISAAETAAVSILRHIDSDLTTFLDGDDGRGVLPGDPWSFTANSSSMLCGPKYCPCYGVTGPHSFCREWEAKELGDA